MAMAVSYRLRCASTILGFLLASFAGGARTTGPAIPIPHPMTMLLRTESVRRELGLSVEQTAAVAKMAEEAELPLWRLRDLPGPERDEAAGPILEKLRTGLRDVLPGRQIDRLEQLDLQARGIQAVFEPRVVEALKLTSGQRERMRAILGSPAHNISPAEVEGSLRAVLSLAQQRILASLMGRPFDLSRLPQIACKAPEVEGVTEWINSPPMTLEKLRGKVVVVHYYAFGCINCIRNLPHYNGWFDRFSRDEVAILGIHRPETEAERDIENVRRKVAEAGIKYPVAVDNESHNWDAWVNRVWPSVYLIDKRGFVRYWWYGELNWQDAQGELWMRARIAELSAESAG